MNGYLVLQDGSVFQGQWQGGKNRAGEVVFNTSHTGYEEIATDPSYFSQIVLMTAPMQGNYGVDKNVWESRQLFLHGFMSLQLRQGEGAAWRTRLASAGVPIMTDFDTRQLTLQLRQSGTPWGALVQANDQKTAVVEAQRLISEQQKMDSDWVYLTSRKTVEVLPGRDSQGPHVAVLDFGCKENILRELSSRCSKLTVLPSRTTAQQISQLKADALMLTNGPGDPAAVQVAPETVRSLLGKMPVFGICMGHQILGLAMGAKTYKLKFGHRGANHPIKDDILNQIYMTSQNHGYAVDAKTLPASVRITHTNLNDGTVAGIYSESLQALGIQYHPESHPGPHEAVRLFDFFIQKMVGK